MEQDIILPSFPCHGQVAAYGTWESPISQDDLAAGSLSLNQVCVNQSNGVIYLGETRPDEDGRGAIVEYRDGVPHDILPGNYSALTQVYEYGGASFVIRESDGHVIFSDLESKIVFDLDPSSQEARAIVPEDRKIWFADFEVHPKDPKWVIAIKEDHHPDKIAAVENMLVAIDSDSREVRTIVSGHDFYARPRFSPDGKHLCWIQWNHPHMPWTSTQLWLGDWEDGHIDNVHAISGVEQNSSSTQSLWGPDGSLFFVDDRTGFWQLYHMVGDSIERIHLRGLEQAEFGEPDWWLGGQTYAPLTKDTLIAFYNLDGSKKAITIDVPSGEWKDIGCPINEVMFNAVKRATDTSFAVIGSTPTSPKSFYIVDISKANDMILLKSSASKELPPKYCSPATSITFPRVHGPGGGEAHAIYHPPTNPEYKGLDGTLPPLVVALHGGPTWHEGPGLYMRDQAWTTRGYALVQVNYVGSSGYGREYMQLLNEQWGVSDIADAASCVEYLANQGLIDPRRVGITGHSAGGYACMQGMAVYPDKWAAGIAESGISSMASMLTDTHKFESHYLKPLCWASGASVEEIKRIVYERSPINSANKIKAPMLILSGEDDNIVPPNQATEMAEKIKAGGTVVELKTYPGEGHIFSKASTLKDMEERRWRWFHKYLVEPVY